VDSLREQHAADEQEWNSLKSSTTRSSWRRTRSHERREQKRLQKDLDDLKWQQTFAGQFRAINRGEPAALDKTAADLRRPRGMRETSRSGDAPVRPAQPKLRSATNQSARWPA